MKKLDFFCNLEIAENQILINPRWVGGCFSLSLGTPPLLDELVSSFYDWDLSSAEGVNK